MARPPALKAQAVSIGLNASFSLCLPKPMMLSSRLIVPGLVLAMACGAFAQNTGTSFCNVTNNSTGMPTTLMGAFGSGVGSDLHLEVTQGVPGQFGYFLAGNEATAGVVVSNGLFCLIGTGTARMYRYNVAGGEFNSLGQFDAGGMFQNISGTSAVTSGFDVPSMLPDTVPVAIMSGDTWHFQLWHRDTPAGPGTSNFSNGLSVTFGGGGTSQPIAGMVQIPAGSFLMGSNAASGAPYFGRSWERPVHSVTISQSFWMSATGITQAQYQGMMGSNPSHFSGANLPVERVTWYNARAYCAALTAQERAAGNVPAGLEYRLPTEAEWEYACRAGTTTEFNIGSSLFCGQAKFGYSHHSNSSCSSNSTTGVGSYAPNAFGLYDMHGNVWEWCLDSWAGYGSAALTDPFVTGGSARVLRGGSWFYNSDFCRSAGRFADDPGDPCSVIGFRVVLAQVLVP